MTSAARRTWKRLLRLLLMVGVCVTANGAGHARPAGASPNAAAAAPVATHPAHAVAARDESAALTQIAANLEAVIEAQANQIEMLGWIIALAGLGLTAIGAGFIGFVAKRVKAAVDDRAVYVLEERINMSTLRLARLTSIFYSHLRQAALELSYNKRQELLERLNDEALDLKTPDGIDRFVTAITDVVLVPLSLFTTLHEISASDRFTPNIQEKIWTLFAEVKAGNVSPQRMRPIVTSLITILETADSHSPALAKLKAFARQLEGKRSADQLEATPAF